MSVVTARPRYVTSSATFRPYPYVLVNFLTGPAVRVIHRAALCGCSSVWMQWRHERRIASVAETCQRCCVTQQRFVFAVSTLIILWLIFPGRERGWKYMDVKWLYVQWYGLRVLKAHGMRQGCLYEVFRCTVLTKLLYASPAWSGFCSAAWHQPVRQIPQSDISSG